MNAAGTPDSGVLRVGGFRPGAGIRHAFSTRRTGMRPGPFDHGACRAFLAAAGFPAGSRPTRLRQVHGGAVHRVAVPTGEPPTGDGLATDLRGTVLLIQTADCLPVLLADGAAGVVGAAHAGWRGVLAGVLESTMARMGELGARPARMQAALGPAIGPCCFEVGEAVARPFAALDPRLVRRCGPRPHVDLPAAARRLLAATGVPLERISGVGACTRCRPDRFYSHRAEPGGGGRLLAAIGLDP